jgi:hypothetical protein
MRGLGIETIWHRDYNEVSPQSVIGNQVRAVLHRSAGNPGQTDEARIPPDRGPRPGQVQIANRINP